MSVDLSAAEAWLKTRSAEHRKRFGQWVTPWWVADLVAQRACETLSSQPIIIDPACGDGRWLVAAARHRPQAILRGFDIDP